ncbi:MAG: hypothetical protein H6607_01910 [Flavobacteriales bacterium]|nr:hypothetical protein [Flavobacteriales bacterium]
MSRDDILKEIENTLQLLQINHQRMVINDSNSEIDLAQMQSHIVKLYTLCDQFSIAKQIIKVPEPVQPITKPKFIPEPIMIEPELEKEPEVIVEVTRPEPVVLPTPKPEPVVEVKPIVPETAPIVEEPAKQEPVAPKPNPVAPPKPTPPVQVNDVYERLKFTKLESIKKGISISKRYELQNELFGNNPEKYNASISALDTANNFDEAALLLANLGESGNWDMDDALVEELKTLILRRYM